MLSARNAALPTYQASVPSLNGRDEAGAKRTFEFFAVSIRNPNTRKAYARALLDAIDTSTLIGLMVYTFARVGAAIQMRVEDVYIQGRRTWVRLTHQFHTLAVRLATVAA